MLIKVIIVKYRLEGFEVTYFLAAPLIPISYLGYKHTAQVGFDLLHIPPEIFWPFLGRCICGFLSDLTLFTAFKYTDYGKAFCVGKLETLFAPFIAYYSLGESLRLSDFLEYFS